MGVSGRCGVVEGVRKVEKKVKELTREWEVEGGRVRKVRWGWKGEE